MTQLIFKKDHLEMHWAGYPALYYVTDTKNGMIFKSTYDCTSALVAAIEKLYSDKQDHQRIHLIAQAIYEMAMACVGDPDRSSRFGRSSPDSIISTAKTHVAMDEMLKRRGGELIHTLC